MFHPEKVRLILLEGLAHARMRNPGYSMRAFAKKVGISQPAISQILSGKRSVTQKTAAKILRGLDKDPREIATLVDKSDNNFRPIDIDSFYLIADWHYYGILSLAETDDFQGSAKWIASRLGLSEATAKDAVRRLLRLGLLVRDAKTKRVKGTGEQFEAVSKVATPALKKASRQNIELADRALEETQFQERDFTAMTLCFDPDRMDDAKRLIKNFRRQFCSAMERHPKKEVYKLTVQLFPLTKRGHS